MKKKNKQIAIILCVLLGVVGVHLIYLGEYHRAKKRFLWFFFCNPVAFYNTLKDLAIISLMSEYQFKSKYCMPKVKGTESSFDLYMYIEKIKPDP